MMSGSQKEKYEKQYAVAPPESEPHKTHKIPPLLNSFRGKSTYYILACVLAYFSATYTWSSDNIFLVVRKTVFFPIIIDY